MAQTQSVREHLQAFRDEIKGAAAKEDAETKNQLRTAMHHLDEAKQQIKSDIAQDNTIRKQDAEEKLAKVQKLSDDANKALNETGNALREKVQGIEKSAKDAVESAK